MTKATLIRTTFNWSWLTGSEVQSIIIKVGAWQHPGRHGMGKLRDLHFHPKEARNRLCLPHWWSFKALTMTHFLQQGHTYSISSNATPWASIFKPPKRENNKIALTTCYREQFLVKGLESQTRMETSHYCWTRSVAWLRDQP